jgi:ribosomal protein L11 methyltransferase
VRADDAELASSILWDAGATGVEERDATTLDRSLSGEVTLVAHFETDEAALEAIEALAPEHTGRLEHIEGDEWKERWKEFFKPTRIGRRLVVRPSWEAFAPEPDDVVITLDPGQAFGTGTHESTRLVLAEVDALVRGGEHVFDVGCGSGILGVGALLLGATDVVATDVDPIAVDVTRENAEINGVAQRLCASTDDLAEVRGVFDLVLANIQSAVLVPMAPALMEKVGPGGSLVLSGLLAPEEQELREAFGALRFVRVTHDRDWIALVFARDP